MDDTTAQPARPVRGRLDGGPTDVSPPVHDHPRSPDGLAEWSNLSEPGGLPPLAVHGYGVRRWTGSFRAASPGLPAERESES